MPDRTLDLAQDTIRRADAQHIPAALPIMACHEQALSIQG